jgi:general secretion pathway protein L
MSILRFIIAFLSRWLDDAAAAFARFGGLFKRRRRARLEEQEDGSFVLRPVRGGAPGKAVGQPLRIEDGKFVGKTSARAQALIAGSEVDLALKSSRFLFRPLELPRRAGEFLDGVVRAQIDRLTPWSPAEAAFGWSAPSPLGADRIVVTVAATARPGIAPFVQALAERRADAIFVSTAEQAEGALAGAPITILAQRGGAEARVRKTRRRLIAVLALALVAALDGLAAAILYGGDLDQRLAGVQHRIALRRAELVSGRGSAADEAVAALEARKRATPAGVIVLEALSQTLPDDTYLTDLHIENGKVQIAGLTRDAPALIRLIEQSQHFTRATFFAPTTRAPTDNGERFHIEAHIEPLFPTPP